METARQVCLTPSRVSFNLFRRLMAHPSVAAWLAHVVIVHSAAALTVVLSPGRDHLRPDLDGVAAYLVAPLALWDGGWYRRIAVDGYGETQASAAFWPIYPTLVDLVTTATGMGAEASGVLLSTVALLGALVALRLLVSRSYGEAVATRTVWLVALSPFAFFFSAFYTESLFLLLSAGAILFARQGSWTRASLLALLATLTRSVGVLVLIPLGLALLAQVRSGGRRLYAPAAQLVAATLGPVVFAVHLDRVWGDPLLMLHAQERWRREFSLPWEALWKGFRRLELIYVNGRDECLDGVRTGDWPLCRDALQISIDGLSDDFAVAAALVALALVPVVIKRLNAGDWIYGLALLVLPLSSGIPEDPLLSLPRFLLVAYPFFITLAILFERRWLYVAALAASIAGLGWLLSIFARAWFVA